MTCKMKALLQSALLVFVTSTLTLYELISSQFFTCFYFLVTSATNDVSSHSPPDDELANNVEHFESQERKTHNFGGPSDLSGGFNLREINRQVNSLP